MIKPVITNQEIFHLQFSRNGTINALADILDTSHDIAKQYLIDMNHSIKLFQDIIKSKYNFYISFDGTFFHGQIDESPIMNCSYNMLIIIFWVYVKAQEMRKLVIESQED